MNKIRQLLNRQLQGFSLIEISIVLIIIGLITAAVFKGQELIESARLQATANDFNRYRLAVHLYRDQFGAWPGNDPEAQSRFGVEVANGDGKGVIHDKEAEQFWLHLYKAKLIETALPPLAKSGGFFSVVANPRGMMRHWLLLSATPSRLDGTLTPHQAMMLKKKMGENDPMQGDLIVLDADDAKAPCVVDGHYNLNNPQSSCIIMLKL